MLSLLIIGLIVDLAPESYAKQALGGGTVQSLLAVAAGIPISFGCALLRVIVTAIYFVGGGTMGGAGMVTKKGRFTEKDDSAEFRG